MRRGLSLIASLAMLVGALVVVPGRANAVAVQTVQAGPAIAASRVTSWFSGNLAPGQSQDRVWLDTGDPTSVLEIGLVPIGASVLARCEFAVTRSQYVQEWNRGRQLHFTITNVGTITCATDIVLAAVPSFRTWSTGGLNPGATRAWTWNNANPHGAVYLVGLSPNGATNTDRCRFEVTRTWYVRQSTGEREYVLRVRNASAIACQADVLLARVSPFGEGFRRPPVAAGETDTVNGNLYRGTVHRPAFLPDAPVSGSCRLEPIIGYYFEQIEAGSRVTGIHYDIRNLSSIDCGYRLSWQDLADV